MVVLPAVAVGESPEGETVESFLGEAGGESVSVDAGLRCERVDALGELWQREKNTKIAVMR